MHTINRKFAAFMVAATVVLPFAASAETTDLQNQIQSLLSQIKALQEQLKTLVASNPGSGNTMWKMGSTTPFGMPPGQMGKMRCIKSPIHEA